MHRQRGFTLIEVLVTMSIMAMIGVMSWIGLDVLMRSRNAIQEQGTRTAQMQIALQQWVSDLDHAWMPATAEPMGWDGKVFRLTRPAMRPELGVTVVAWTVRNEGAGEQLMRWQSEPMTQMAQWRNAWEQAAQWARSTGHSPGSVVLAPAFTLDIFVWSGNAWVNGQTSAQQDSGKSGSSRLQRKTKPQPQGVRMMLTTSNGIWTKDWAALSLSESKS